MTKEKWIYDCYIELPKILQFSNSIKDSKIITFLKDHNITMEQFQDLHLYSTKVNIRNILALADNLFDHTGIYIIPEGITELYGFDGSPIKILYLPKSLNCIQFNAFSNCDNLQKVVFHSDSSVETIGRNAFKNCYSLIDINLPNTCKLENNVFKNTEYLSQILKGNMKCQSNIFKTLDFMEKALLGILPINQYEFIDDTIQILQKELDDFIQCLLNEGNSNNIYYLIDFCHKYNLYDKCINMLLQKTEQLHKYEERLLILNYIHEKRYQVNFDL